MKKRESEKQQKENWDKRKKTEVADRIAEESVTEEKEEEITLSEEEIDAMYARFCERLQEQGLTDADGNITEKTRQLRQQAVEKAKREEQEGEKQESESEKESEKSDKRKMRGKSEKNEPNGQKGRKVVKYGRTAAKAAGVVLVVGACVFGASMTSQANRIRLVETVHGVWNGGDATGTNNGEVRKYSEGSLDEAKKQITGTLHIAVPEFYYTPEGMVYREYSILQEIQLAIIKYQYNGNSVYFKISANEKDLSQGSWKDRKKIQIQTLDNIIDVEMGTITENNEDSYYVNWKYKDAYYQLSGKIEKDELLKILNEMQYNL